MAAPQFLVAKYAPDLRRMEQRNFGVILWSNGHVAARFAGETQTPKGGINPPAHLHVNSKPAYRKWVRYWRALLNSPAIRDEEGRAVDRTAPAFMDAVLSKSKQQYRLVRGGEFMTDLSPTEINAAADELYEELVAVGTEAKQTLHAEASRALTRAYRKAVSESGLNKRVGFRDGLPWVCHVNGEPVPFVFDCGIHLAKHPVAIIDRVNLWSKDDVYKTAFEFDATRREYNALKKDDCIALVYPTEDDMSSSETKSIWKMLDSIVTVLDMRNEDSARLRLSSVAVLSA